MTGLSQLSSVEKDELYKVIGQAVDPSKQEVFYSPRYSINKDLLSDRIYLEYITEDIRGYDFTSFPSDLIIGTYAIHHPFDGKRDLRREFYAEMIGSLKSNGRAIVAPADISRIQDSNYKELTSLDILSGHKVRAQGMVRVITKKDDPAAMVDSTKNNEKVFSRLAAAVLSEPEKTSHDDSSSLQAMN